MVTASAIDERSWSYAGWRVVAALFLVEAAIFGFGLYGLGIYVSQLRLINGWSTTVISAGTTLCLVLGSLLSMFVSDLLMWIGPRRLVLCGIAALATGLGLLASATTILQLYAGFLVLALGWVGLGTITAASIVGAWFEQKRGLAISLTFTGATCSGIVLAPGLVLLVERIGYRDAILASALIAMMVLVPVVLLWVRHPSTPPTGAQDKQAATSMTRIVLLRDLAFWSLTAPFALALFVQVAFIVHQLSILMPTMGFQSAGLAVSVTTAMALAGRLVLGMFVDGVNPRRAAAVSILTQALALGVIVHSKNDISLLLACAVFGFSIGNLITLPALIVQREFPPASFSIVLGLSMAIGGVVNACGPAAMGLMRDVTGGYTTPLVVGIAIQLVAIITVLIRPAPVERMA